MLKPGFVVSLTLTSFAFSPIVSADTDYQSPMPPDIVEALFDSYGDSNFAVYSDIPNGFPAFAVPQGFSVVGSVSQMSTLRVVFETESSEDDAIAAASEAFFAENWIPFPLYRPQQQQTGFISPQELNLSRAEVLCHDELGHLTLRYTERDSGNYLSAGVSLYRSRQVGGCEQQLAMQQDAVGQLPRTRGLRQYLPRMEIPEAQSLPRPVAFISGGSSSTGNSVETDGYMKSDEEIDAIYEFFAEQIVEQGWVLDSESVGSRSANGTWTKAEEANLNLIGTLSILDVGDDEFELQFKLTAEGLPGNNSSLFRSFGQ